MSEQPIFTFDDTHNHTLHTFDDTHRLHISEPHDYLHINNNITTNSVNNEVDSLPFEINEGYSTNEEIMRIDKDFRVTINKHFKSIEEFQEYVKERLSYTDPSTMLICGLAWIINNKINQNRNGSNERGK